MYDHVYAQSLSATKEYNFKQKNVEYFLKFIQQHI